MTVRAIIWDMGGVLVRTEDLGPRTRLAEKLGLTFHELESVVFGGQTGTQATCGEINPDEHWARVCTILQYPPDDLPALQDAFWGGDRLDTHLVDYIRGLRRHYTTALLSNAWADLRQIIETKYPIEDAFDDIIISAEVGVAKPDPRIYQITLERLKIAPDEAVFVDDFIENIEAAREAGLHAIHFRSPAQALAELEQLLDKHGKPGEK